MLKNVKIGKVLSFSFLLLSIFVAIVGGIGLFNLNKSNVDSGTIYNGQLIPITQLADMHKNLLKIRTNNTLMMYERDASLFDQRKAEIDQWVKQNDELYSHYQASYMSDAEKALAVTYKESLTAYREERTKQINLIQKADFAGALALAPTLADVRTKVENNIENLIEYNKNAAATLKDDIQVSFNASFILMIGILAIAFIIAITLAIWIPRSINLPIKEIVAATDQMAKGNLNVTVDYRSKNEFGQLSDGVMTTVRAMQTYIGNIAEILGKMAKGDLTVTVDMDYIGDFAQIKESMVEITDSLNDILSQINQSSNQVLSGAAQVSSAAQSLSQGTTEQASSIEELSSTIQDISTQIAKNAENAQSAKMIAVDSSTTIESANVKMMDMISAMENINETSRKISKIIKTIDDIAFQTNILALNAAVEAARAGEAGKGFAVVADEVRNLASKSAEAAKDTTVLIENSIQAVDKGTKIADETAKSLNSIVESAKRSADLVSLISEASSRQASAIMQTTQGVEQISSVVQTNSATAEESAAASEELSGQADMLNQLVGKFKLKNADYSPASKPKLDLQDFSQKKSIGFKMNSKY